MDPRLKLQFFRHSSLIASKWNRSLLALVCMNHAVAQDLQQQAHYRETARTLSELLPARHVTARLLDDEISTRAFDTFIRKLDPSRSIFKPSDLADFEPFRMRLDDEMRDGNLRFADLVFQRWQERRKTVQSVPGVKTDLDAEERLVMYLNCLTQAYDPHTIYRAPETQANFQIETQLSLQGIGATLGVEDGLVVVKSVVPGGAADQDGRLKSGDKIVSIQQENAAKAVVVFGMKLEQVVGMIRGEIGTVVRLFVERDGEITEIDLVRAKIQLQEGSAYGEVLQRSKEPDGKSYRIGYIGLPSFYSQEPKGQRQPQETRSATRDVKRLLQKFTLESVDVVVLDLSSNDRGSLSEAISCAGLFLERGPIVQLKNAKKETQTLEDEDSGTTWDGPLVVVTSRASVSASEVFAGAMRCYERALIVGAQATHGKGTVQSILELGDRVANATDEKAYGALKITTNQYYFPDGTSNQQVGVRADIVLPQPEAIRSSIESDLPYALPSDSIAAVPFRKCNQVNEATRQELRRLSALRMQSENQSQSLQSSGTSTPNQPGRFMSNVYNEEVLRIAVDYAGM